MVVSQLHSTRHLQTMSLCLFAKLILPDLEYDENLRDYYDYARYGLERMNAEEGRVVKSGYVSYHGVLTLEDLMMDDPAEQYQRNQGFNFQMT